MPLLTRREQCTVGAGCTPVLVGTQGPDTSTPPATVSVKERAPVSLSPTSGLQSREDDTDPLCPSSPVSGCFGKDALSFPLLLEEMISQGRLHQGEWTKSYFQAIHASPWPPPARSQHTRPPLAPGTSLGSGSQAAATTCPLFGEPGEAIGYKSFLR